MVSGLVAHPAKSALGFEGLGVLAPGPLFICGYTPQALSGLGVREFLQTIGKPCILSGLGFREN
jgi:hypothetical protein